VSQNGRLGGTLERNTLCRCFGRVFRAGVSGWCFAVAAILRNLLEMRQHASTIVRRSGDRVSRTADGSRVGGTRRHRTPVWRGRISPAPSRNAIARSLRNDICVPRRARNAGRLWLGVSWKSKTFRALATGSAPILKAQRADSFIQHAPNSEGQYEGPCEGPCEGQCEGQSLRCHASFGDRSLIRQSRRQSPRRSPAPQTAPVTNLSFPLLAMPHAVSFHAGVLRSEPHVLAANGAPIDTATSRGSAAPGLRLA